MSINLDDRNIIDESKDYVIYQGIGDKFPKMLVSKRFAEKHIKREFSAHLYNTDIELGGIHGKDKYTSYGFDIVFYDTSVTDEYPFGVAAYSGDYGFGPSMYRTERHKLGKIYRLQVFNKLKDIINKEFPKNKNTMETTMEEKKLREFIRGKVLEYLTQKKVLQEAKEKEGKGKPTSGLTKTKNTDTHTEKTKSKNPPAKKVTDGGPENKTLADAEPTKVDSETKEMKQPENTEFTDRGKYVKEGSGYETECMGIELKVKGNSYADINHFYMLAQIRKALEGRGQVVKKVTIEMGDKEKVEESKKIQHLRKKINEMIVNELKKKSLTETGEMSKYDIEPGGEDYEWAKAIQDAVLKMSDWTDGKIKFLKMNPFDKYRGPYASVTINGKFDSVWSVPNEDGEDILYLERLEWTGTPNQLAMAINGVKEMIKKVKNNTESYR